MKIKILMMLVLLIVFALAMQTASLADSPSPSPSATASEQATGLQDGEVESAAAAPALGALFGVSVDIWLISLAVVLILVVAMVLFFAILLSRRSREIDNLSDGLNGKLAKREHRVALDEMYKKFEQQKKQIDALQSQLNRLQQNQASFSSDRRSVEPAPSMGDTASRPPVQPEAKKESPRRSEMDLLLEAANGVASTADRMEWERAFSGYNWGYIQITKGDGLPYVLSKSLARGLFIGVRLDSLPDTLVVLPSFNAKNAQEPDIQKVFRVSGYSSGAYRVSRAAIARIVNREEYLIDEKGRGLLEG